MLTVSDIVAPLEKMAPLSLQESYDNSGLLIGNFSASCTGALLCLDVTEEVVKEAIEKKCNLIIAHHPLIFTGMKRIVGKNDAQLATQLAIKHDISVYACHTNLDNVQNGVNKYIADKMGLLNCSVLSPKPHQLRKLSVFVPETHLSALEKALFDAGAGHIGHYAECNFVSEGKGSFKPERGAHPFSGKIGTRNIEKEMKMEIILPVWKETAVIESMKQNHPYEEVAYDIFSLENEWKDIGSGMIGELPEEMGEVSFLEQISTKFNLKVVKHTQFLGKKIKKIALCGGAGGFLMKEAAAKGADVFLTSDLKYHDYFECKKGMILIDMGHYESEQYTIELFYDVLKQNFPTFALLKTSINTNPIRYFVA